MSTQYIKYAIKCEKFFLQIIGGMAPFGQGVAAPMGTVNFPQHSTLFFP